MAAGIWLVAAPFVLGFSAATVAARRIPSPWQLRDGAAGSVLALDKEIGKCGISGSRVINHPA